jgi:hypothetical protein
MKKTQHPAKSSYTIMLLFAVTISCTQKPARVEEEFNAELYRPTYTLPTPDGWNTERFGIPIDFAPAIPYKGVEDIRFAPGWSDPNANDYWSYAFLWYIEGKPETNSQTIEKNLTAYYNGLVGENIQQQNIPKEKLVDVKVSMQSTTVTEGDLETYSGTIDMLDYMTQKPITLNVIVHVKQCASEADKTFIFYELSPKPLTDDVWKGLDGLWAGFECRE